MNFRQEKHEINKLSIELLDYKDELNEAETFIDEGKQIDAMRVALFDIFRAVD